MTKNAKRFISIVLALSLVFSLVIPAGATGVHTHADELVGALDGFSVEALLDDIKVDASDIELEVEYDAPLILADPNVEVDEDDPAIIGFETELKNIKVWDEAAQQPVPLTAEEIQTVLGLYQQYLDYWDANADTLGLQTPFFLSFNDNGEDGLGVLGEMLSLAGVPVDAVRAGFMTIDDLTGMILNFFYGDQLGVKYYGRAIEAARDEVMALIKASGAKTEAQKLLVINDWLAHNNTFDMPYIMNSGKENPPMVAEQPVKNEHYDEVLATMTEVYKQILTDTFKQQIVDGLEAEFKYQYYAGAVKEIMYQGGLAQASQDPELVAAVKAQIGWDAAYAEALAAEEKKVYDAAYEEYTNDAHEHQVTVAITWTEQADGTFTASAAGACSVAGCTAELTIAAPVVTSTNTATCTEAGVTTYTAAVESVTASLGTVAFTVANAEKAVDTAALGHNFVEGVCSVCGEAEVVEPEIPEEPVDPEIPEQNEEEEVPVLNAEGDEEEPAPEADPADEFAKAEVAAQKEAIEAAAAAAADEATGLQTAIDYVVTGGTAEADTEIELQVQQAAEDFVAANDEALRTDPVGFIDSQEMFQQMVPVTDANGNYIIGEDGQPVMMPLSQQLHMGWDAFWADAQQNGVEIQPGVKMTVDQIVTMTMDQPQQDPMLQKPDGSYMTPNEAVPVFAAQAAAGLTDGIINYWEGSHFGALGFGTSVCLGYTKAFTYLVQCLHPEIYGVNGADTDMSVASNWKTRDQVYVYNEDGSIDINQNYVVDAVRITFDASVTMYGQTEDNFNNDHFWNAAKVDGKWYYFDPCYTDVFTEVMMRDRVETDGQMNHLYFMFSHNSAVQMYDGNFAEIKTLYATAASDTTYEDAWFSRAKSNVYFEDGYAYYMYDSTDMLTLMTEFENENTEMEMEESVYKLVRHAITDTDAGDGDEDFETLVIFNYKEDDDSDPVARVWNPEAREMSDNEMLTALYVKHAEYADIYPSVAINAAYYNGKVYFNLANCILSYDVTTNEVALVKEYNTVHGQRDKTKAFGGMAFSVVSNGGDFTVENRPIAGMTIKDDGNMYVSVATNFAFISGKADRFDPASEGYGYEYEESNYNRAYSSYSDYGDYTEEDLEEFGYTKEINDNDEFMWTANFVEKLSMSHLAGTRHNYAEVSVDAFCGVDAYTENRCSTCGASEPETRVYTEGTALDHHFIEFSEIFYTKDDGGSWNRGVCYVCTVCGYAVTEPVEPTGMMASQEGAMESYEEALAIYEAAKASAGHTYVPTDAVWAEDNSSVTFTQLECSSVCQERKPYIDCLLEDDTPLAYTLEETTNESTIVEVTGMCPTGVTQLYDASGEVEVAEGETVAYTVQKLVELEPADHTYAEGVCQICGDCSVKRIFGEGRVETGIEVAEELKAVLGVEKFDAIILANGDNFADALAGSYLAAMKNAPILLHRNSSAGDDLNEAYISENLVAGGTVYLLGGTAAIPESVEERIAALDCEVVRLSGNTRFDTNLAILEAAGIAADDEILVTTGWEFADCLSASASGKPILMLNTIKGELTEEQIAFFELYAENDYTIIGGTAAVSEEMEAAIEAIVSETTRIAGGTREETSAKIAETYFNNPEYVLVAYSRNFPDALCGGPLAYAMNAPLLLVNAGKEDAAAAYVAAEGVAAGHVLGGEAALTDETVKTVFALPENAVIAKK